MQFREDIKITIFKLKQYINFESFRKSVDVAQSLMHYEFVEILYDEDKLEVYSHNDKDFKGLLVIEV